MDLNGKYADKSFEVAAVLTSCVGIVTCFENMIVLVTLAKCILTINTRQEKLSVFFHMMIVSIHDTLSGFFLFLRVLLELILNSKPTFVAIQC